MNPKTIATIIITTFSAFALGWLLHGTNPVLNGPVKNNNSSKNTSSLTNTTNEKIDFSKKISGRFVMKKASCAGFNFINATCVSWTNEMDCTHPDTLKIRWLNHSTFFTQDIVQHNENCPPRVWIYQVISFDGHNLRLKDIWTGWENISQNYSIKDVQLEFEKQDFEK